MFYIGVGVNVSGASRGQLQLGLARPQFDKAQTIGAAFASSPEGPWTRLKEPLLTATEAWECGGGTDCGVSNPALLIRHDGKLNMFYRGNQDRWVHVDVSLFHAFPRKQLISHCVVGALEWPHLMARGVARGPSPTSLCSPTAFSAATPSLGWRIFTCGQTRKLLVVSTPVNKSHHVSYLTSLLLILQLLCKETCLSEQATAATWCCTKRRQALRI